MDRGNEFADMLRASRRPGDNRPVSNIMTRKKPKDGSNTFIANTLMEGIRRTWVMMREQESSYTAVRGGMEDLERDELDGAVRTFVSDCSERIDELKLRMTANDQSRNSVDERAHLKGMVLVLLERLDGLSQYFQTFKAFRVKQVLGDRSRYAAQDDKGTFAGASDAAMSMDDAGEEDLELSAEEQAAFEQENVELQQQLDSKLEQLRNAEREMNLVTSMCELTSRKILEQAQEIDALYDTVVKAVEDIDLGNVQLQKAAEASVSSRVFMLVFLFVASLVLLFLHWFMD